MSNFYRALTPLRSFLVESPGVKLSSLALSHPPPGDRSPAGSFTATLEPGGIAIGGNETRHLEFEQPVEQVTISDRGMVALTARREDGSSEIYRATEEGSFERLTRGFTVGSIDLDSDGDMLAYAKHDRVFTIDETGEREVASLPRWVDRVEFLEDDRLLICSRDSGWGVAPIPTYFVLETNGTVAQLEDVKQADSLGRPVIEPLTRTYSQLFPGIDNHVASSLVDRFGYRLPETRMLSKDKSQAVFSTEGKMFLARLPEGRIESLAHAGRPSKVFWAPQGRPPAVACEEGLVVGRSRLPHRVDQADWNKEGRVLAAQVEERDGPMVWAHRDDGNGFYPVARGRLLGWNDDLMVIERDGNRLEIPAEPLYFERFDDPFELEVDQREDAVMVGDTEVRRS